MSEELQPRTVPTTIEIPRELHRGLKAWGAERGFSLKKTLVMALKEFYSAQKSWAP